jgi:hypothetical protein
MSADLLELVDPPSNSVAPDYPTEADLTQGTLAQRATAWRHRLVGKKLLPVQTALPKGMESVSGSKYIDISDGSWYRLIPLLTADQIHVSASILPENHQIVGVNRGELMEFIEDR